MKSPTKASEKKTFVSEGSVEDPLITRRVINQEPETRLSHLRKLEAMGIFVERWKKGISPEKDPAMNALLEKFSLFVGDYIQLLDQIPASIANPRQIAATGLEQLYHEWSMLSRASEQRLQAVGSDNGLGENLLKAQNTLTAYLDCWRGAGDKYLLLKPEVGHPRVVVYFDKIYGISRSVYAPEIPVISIPLTDYESEQRWQAMAHEAGHHLYWNALDLGATDTLQEQMQMLVAESLWSLVPEHESLTGSSMASLQQALNCMVTWQRWIEEVFADVVGTMLAGPAYVVTAQELAAEQVGQVGDFALDDREHPCPYLRPVICLETLRLMAQSTSSNKFRSLMQSSDGIIERLQDRWKAFCGSGAGQQVHRFSGLTLVDLEKGIELIVAKLLSAEIWPMNRSLLDLIEFFGQNGMSIEQSSAVENMFNGVTPLPDLEKIYEGTEQELPQDPVIPERLQPLWNYLATKTAAAELEPGDTTALWRLLLTLGLSVQHGHETAHSSCAKHWFLGRSHRHDPDTGQTIVC